MWQIPLPNKKYVIFLDHQKLIEEEYKQFTKHDLFYRIKPQLFYFHDKSKQLSSNKLSPVAGAKRSFEKTSDFQNHQVCNIWQQCLVQVKKFGYFNAELVAADNLPRYWDEACDFPKFHGQNNTSSFQNYAFQSKTYLIPPKCRFFNNEIQNLAQLLPQLQSDCGSFDLIVLDPPWLNKYIRRLKRVRRELAYQMLDNEQLERMPLQALTHTGSLVLIWCTNSSTHQQAVEQKFLPSWGLRLLHQLKWLKLNTAGQPIGPCNADKGKQPYEILYIACHKNAEEDFALEVGNVEMICSVPSIVHSHKPPLLQLFKQYLPENPKCLELFARYLQPSTTAVGLEVLKLMDERLYQAVSVQQECLANS